MHAWFHPPVRVASPMTSQSGHIRFLIRVRDAKFTFNQARLGTTYDSVAP